MEKKTFSCRTLDTELILSLEGTGLYLDSLLFHGENRLCKTPAALPAAYRVGGKSLPFDWKFVRAQTLPDAVLFLFYDNATRCSYRMTFKGRRDLAGPVECSGVLINTAHDTVRIEPGDLFRVTYRFADEPDAFTVKKESGYAEGFATQHTWTALIGKTEGTGIYRTKVTKDSPVENETNTDQTFNENGSIPMIYLDGGDFGSYFALEWTSCTLRAERCDGGVLVTANLQNKYVTDTFNTRIPAGGSFDVPPCYIGTYDGDLDDGSNVFKHWFWEEKTPKVLVYNEDEPFTQTDYRSTDCTYANKVGFESAKWDLEWWNAFAYYLKDEAVDADAPIKRGETNLCDDTKFLRGKEGALREIADHYHENGLNFVAYTLLHNGFFPLELASEGHNAHSEWFAGAYADLGNVECVEHLKRAMHRYFTENHIDTWRSDWEPIAHESVHENRHDANGTDVQYWTSHGFYELCDYLLETIPGFRYESCSSAGSMKDFATAHRAVNINCDDFANFWSLHTTFYDGTYCIHPAQLQLPLGCVSGDPSYKFYAGLGTMDLAARTAIFAPMMTDQLANTGHDAEYLELHKKKIRPLIRHANLYHTLPRPDGVHWDAIQYGYDALPENRIGGAMFVVKPSPEEGNEKRLRVRGLNPDLTYNVNFYERKEQSYTASGKELLEKGITVRMEEELASEMIFFEIR